MLLAINLLSSLLCSAELVRILEETESVLGLKNTTTCCINLLHAYETLVESILDIAYETLADHIHIDTCLESLNAD